MIDDGRALHGLRSDGLRRHPDFSLLDADERAVLAEHVELKQFAAREMLIHPPTDDSVDGHSIYAMWLGSPVPLKLVTLRRNYRPELLPSARGRRPPRVARRPSKLHRSSLA